MSQKNKPELVEEKPKKPTLKSVQSELQDLQEVAGQRQDRIKNLEIQAQRARTILKKTGKPGASLQQEHFMFHTMIQDLRKLLKVDLDGE